MSLSLKGRIRDDILDLKGYSSARDECREGDLIFLDANENALGSPLGTEYCRYPDPHQTNLKKRLSQYRDTPSKNIFIGHGSDEIIDLLIRATTRAGIDEVMIFPPTYGMYKVSAKIHGAKICEVDLNQDFSLDLESIFDHISEKTKLMILCSPNNPTGNVFSKKQVQFLLQNFKGIVLIDEAYIDFCPSATFRSFLTRFPQLVIMQTFSKAWGLASLRLGMAFADENIIEVLDKMAPPYNISGPTQQLATEAIEKAYKKDDLVKDLLEQKTWLQEKLQSLPCVEKVFPSFANFLLVKVSDPQRIIQYLKTQGIVVRDRSHEKHCQNCLRVSVGSESENQKLVELLFKGDFE